jgi:hypothetical protein
MVVEHKSPVKFISDFFKREPLGHAGAAGARWPAQWQRFSCLG